MTTAQDLFAPGDATDFFERIPAPFHAGASGYDAANAWWLAELSRLVYRETDRKPFLDRAGLEEIGPPMAQCLIVRAKDRTWAAVVFRGTQNVRDWMFNMDVRRTRWTAGEVHEGFKNALDPIWPRIASVLDSLDCPFFCTGHSLGAAMATLAASERPPRATYTYGSPLVGDAAFATACAAAPLFRIVNDRDTVANVPPPVLGYHHAGELHRIGEDAPAELGEALADHAPINYVRLLAARL